MPCRGPIVIVLSFVFVLFCGPALAHLPRLAGLAVATVIKDPEISQAFYGKLNGAPAIYTINAPSPFHLYLQLLSPKTADARTDFSAAIIKDGRPLADLQSADGLWSVMYEPFGNDYYFQGPEFETDASAGVYTVEISNPGNQGAYALAVGKTEIISLGGLLGTLSALPVLKTEYFGEPAWTAYNNFIGLSALIILAVIGIVSYFVVKLIYVRRLNKKLDHEYQKLREAGGDDRG